MVLMRHHAKENKVQKEKSMEQGMDVGRRTFTSVWEITCIHLYIHFKEIPLTFCDLIQGLSLLASVNRRYPFVDLALPGTGTDR